MHYAEFAEDEVSNFVRLTATISGAECMLTSFQSAALLQAIKDYENNKWKVIGQKVGKPAKVCGSRLAKEAGSCYRPISVISWFKCTPCDSRSVQIVARLEKEGPSSFSSVVTFFSPLSAFGALERNRLWRGDRQRHLPSHPHAPVCVHEWTDKLQACEQFAKEQGWKV